MSEQSWDLWANRSKDWWTHVGKKRWVELHMCGDVFPVKVTEDEDGEYWGWRRADADADSAPTMIWPTRLLLDTCFTYGVDSAIERGAGAIVRMNIEAREDA